MVITSKDLEGPNGEEESPSAEEQLDTQANPTDNPAAGDTESPRNQSELEPDDDMDWGVEYSPNENDEK